MALLVGEKLFEQVLAHIVPDRLAELTRGLVRLARVVLAGEVALEHFLDRLADAKRGDALQVRMAFEEDDALDQLVGVVHLLDGLLALLLGELAVAPILEQTVVQPVLVDRSQFQEQRLVKPLDDLCFALHNSCSRLGHAFRAHDREM